MINVSYSIDKSKVYDDVAKLTAYVGAKKTDDVSYDIVSTTEENEEMLERFWKESIETLTNALKRFNITSNESGNICTIQLQLSDSYNTLLTNTIQEGLESYLINNIASKWFKITSKDDVTQYATEAGISLDGLMSKILYKKPIRPIL